MSSAIYALSADPITNGHLNIIKRALETFDRLIVGIGINANKKYTFTLAERKDFAQTALSEYKDRIVVESYSGLLTDFAYEQGISTIIRGARNTSDFDFEKLLFDINQGMQSGLETYIMIASPTLSHISSSAVKELQLHQAKNVIDYVPLKVKEALELRISHQFKIGITGGIGAGKTYVGEKLSELKLAVPIHHIDMDVIGRFILSESMTEMHQNVRKALIHAIGDEIEKNGVIVMSKLLHAIFDGPDRTSKRKTFDSIMAEPIMHETRKRMRDLTGIILIGSALFVEADVCNIVNNNFVFVNCALETRNARMKTRGYTRDQRSHRHEAQLDPLSKLAGIQKRIESEHCGFVMEFDNNKERELDNISDLGTRLITLYTARK